MSSIPSTASPFWIKKPFQIISTSTSSNSDHHHHLYRHMSLLDLMCLGIGGTVGSGIFVLTGQIAVHQAGPATFVSMGWAGLAALLSGLSFAELSGHIPGGSTYAYSYICWGQGWAVLAAACLTLEYLISGAAVARSWGDKVTVYLDRGNGDTSSLVWGFNWWAAGVSLTSTLILWAGVQESKSVTNAVTMFKLGVVALMIVGGLTLFQKANMTPLAPFGWKGVIQGTTASFFGYLGYDEICCVAAEAKHPHDVPRAVLGTLGIVTVIYVLAALALTGMQYYEDISPISGFPQAFQANHWNWAAQLTAWGELLTLPVVVLISLVAQPRLTELMAQDGLLPAAFAQRDARGNLRHGVLVSGLIMTLVALVVPFRYLDDWISAGILVAFCMTNSCLVLLRCESPKPHVLEQWLGIYNGLCLVTALLWVHPILPPVVPIVATFVTLGALVYLARQCPPTPHFGGSIYLPAITDTHYFRTPGVPYIPCLGMALNWYMIAQLDLWNILVLVLYLGITVLVYWMACANHVVGHSPSRFYETVAENDDAMNETAVAAVEPVVVGRAHSFT